MTLKNILKMNMEEMIKENNAMLKEIVTWIRTEQSNKHKANEELKNLLTNIIANLLIRR